LNDNHKHEIEKIMENMDCSRDFDCAKNNFENLCEVKCIGFHEFIECSEKNPADCPHGETYEKMRLCQCPLRVYLFRELGM